MMMMMMMFVAEEVSMVLDKMSLPEIRNSWLMMPIQGMCQSVGKWSERTQNLFKSDQK